MSRKYSARKNTDRWNNYFGNLLAIVLVGVPLETSVTCNFNISG